MTQMKGANKSTKDYTCVCPNDYCGEELTNRFLRSFVTKKAEGIKPFKCPSCGTKCEVRKRGAKQHEVGLV
jgi:hypothetical protein